MITIIFKVIWFLFKWLFIITWYLTKYTCKYIMFPIARIVFKIIFGTLNFAWTALWDPRKILKGKRIL